MLKNLLHDLEVAACSRNPRLRVFLRPPLSPNKITKLLSKAGVQPVSDVVTDLYAWHDGTAIIGEHKVGERSIIPVDAFHFVGLDHALAELQTLKETAKHHSGRSVYEHVGSRFLPVLWDGATSLFLLDFKDPKGRVCFFFMDCNGGDMFKPAYASIDEFILSMIRANRNDDQLQFFNDNLVVRWNRRDA